MVNEDLNSQIKALQEKIKYLNAVIIGLKLKSERDLWNNHDMMRNWSVSLKTLASWRAKGLIDYFKFSGRIWYTKRHRKDFIIRNSIYNVDEIQRAPN